MADALAQIVAVINTVAGDATGVNVPVIGGVDTVNGVDPVTGTDPVTDVDGAIPVLITPSVGVGLGVIVAVGESVEVAGDEVTVDKSVAVTEGDTDVDVVSEAAADGVATNVNSRSGKESCACTRDSAVSTG